MRRALATQWLGWRIRWARASDGFTLIEVMLAVAVLALVMAMLAGSFHAVASGKRSAEDRMATNQEARAILWQMTKELRGAVQTQLISSHVLVLGKAQTRNGLPLDNFTVSTLDPSHRPTLSSFGPEEIVSYTTAPNPDRPGWFILMRDQQSALLNEYSSAGTQPLILAGNLISLHIRYFDGEQWSESWDSGSLPLGRALPQEVSLDLSMAGPGGRPFDLSTRVTVPMAFSQW